MGDALFSSVDKKLTVDDAAIISSVLTRRWQCNPI